MHVAEFWHPGTMHAVILKQWVLLITGLDYWQGRREGGFRGVQEPPWKFSALS